MASNSAEVVARRDAQTPRISIVVPAMNEALNLAVVLPQLPRVHEVILVDGGSVDGTVEAARRALGSIITVRQARRGRGNAVATGLARVSGDIVVMFDADGSADPLEIERFVAALTSGADFAKGSRCIPGGGSADITAFRAMGNKVLNTIFNVYFKTHYSDLCYGYNAFWADLIPLLDLPDHATAAPRSGDLVWGDGLEIEMLISCRLAAAGVSTAEVPSVERLRLFGQSNLRAISDGFRVLRTLRTERARAREMRGRESAVGATAKDRSARYAAQGVSTADVAGRRRPPPGAPARRVPSTGGD